MIVRCGSGFDFVEETCFGAKVKPRSTRIVNADFVTAWAPGAFPLTRFPIEWNHSIEKESLKIRSSSRSLAKKSGTFLRSALNAVRNSGPALPTLARPVIPA
jgi:hypothetical protein